MSVMQKNTRFFKTSLPQDVREAAAVVARKAGSVHINHSNLADYAALLLTQDIRPAMSALDRKTFGAGKTDEDKAAYVMALDAINFGSGYFKTAQDQGAALEYADLALALRRAFDNGQLAKPAHWVQVTAAQCQDIFDMPVGVSGDIDDLMTLYATHLAAAGQVLVSEYDGKALNVLQAAQKSAVKLAELVAQWPGFEDIAFYDGMPVPIFKRAQILAADMHLALCGQGVADFDDLGDLTIFADNMVPHVLRHDGILNYAPPLAAAIDAGEFLQPGSAVEVELRAVALHAVECLKQAAHQQGKTVTSLDLDRILWTRGYEQTYFSKPPHRTMTVWY